MSPPSGAPTGAPLPPAALQRALRRLLRPLVRLLLANHVTQPLLAGLLKGVYVEVGEEELADAGTPQTASRLSLLTGVHRKDIRRLRESAAETDAPPASVSLGARLVARWTADPEFLDAEGHPLALRRSSAAAEGPSFERLVASVSTDIRPRAVLDEWLRLGVVELADDRVRLNAEAFVPERGFDEKAHYFGRHLHDHIAAGAHNLAGEKPALLERSVYYDELSPDSVAELAALSEQLGMEALQAVNRRAMALQAADADRPEHEPRMRMRLGIYFYETKTTEREDA